MNKKSVKRQEKTKKYYKESSIKDVQDKIEQQLYATGQRLRYQRKLVKMPQEKVGKMLGVSKQVVSMHENGKKLSISYLEQYSRLYNCSIKNFFTDESATNDGSHEINQQEAMQRVIGKIKSLYKHDSFRVLTFLDVDFREVQRWEAFSKSNASYKKETNDKPGIQSVPLLQFVRIALELEVPIAEIFFGK